MLRIKVDVRDCHTEAEAELAVCLVHWLKRSHKEKVSVDLEGPLPYDKKLSPSHNGLTVNRIDYVSAGARCFVCNRPLTSGSAFIVVDGAGKEMACGPTCVNHLIPNLKSINCPNFTRASKTALSEGKRKLRAQPLTEQTHAHEVEEYIKLRYCKMSEFRIPFYPPLDHLASEYLSSGVLSDQSRQYISNMLRRIEISRPGLSLKNLQHCYAYDHWLSEAMNKLPAEKHDYLGQLRLFLRQRLYLSEAQVAGANRWFAKLEGVPELDPVFSWAKDQPCSTEQ